MDLLLSAIQSLLASTDNKDDIYAHITKAAITYNNIADMINKKYKGINIAKA